MALKIGDAVTSGEGEDRETGKVKRIDPVRGVLVAWSCGAETWMQQPKEEGSAMPEFGIFSEEGMIEGGMYSEEEANARNAATYPGEGYKVAEVCSEHAEQERETCEECNAEEE